MYIQRYSTVKCPYWCRPIASIVRSFSRSYSMADLWCVLTKHIWLNDRWNVWIFSQLTWSQMTSFQYLITLLENL